MSVYQHLLVGGIKSEPMGCINETEGAVYPARRKMSFDFENTLWIVTVWLKGRGELLHGWERNICAEGCSVGLAPEGGNGLELCKELDTSLAVEVEVTQEGLLATGEGEHWQRNWDWNVDTNLSGFDLKGELASSSAVVGEDGSTVTPLVGIGKGNSVIEGVSIEADKNRAKDLLLVAVHVGCHVGQDSWLEPVAVRIASNCVVIVANNAGGALVDTRLDEILCALKGSRGDHWAEISTGLVTSVQGELLSEGSKIIHPLLCLTDENSSGESHATLPGSTESGTDKGVEGGSLVGIWKDDAVVLGSHVGLNTLSVCSTTSVDVATGSVGTDKGDGLNVWVIADEVDAINRAVDHVENTVWHASVLGKLGQKHGSAWHTLGWLEEEGVSACEGKWEHPQRNHGWEVERADTCSNAKWKAVAVSVHVTGNSWHILTHESGGNVTRGLNNL
eukprot:m.186081 g.186081  ORF g.186081 m.186081 type:complete len:448 (-) comp14747_c0_seq1:684-2027(-)